MADKKEKILLIRMLEQGEVLNIGVPALRHFQQKFPEGDIHFLTYADGKDVIALAEPNATLHELNKGEWPNDFLAALEVFLGLAEQIVAEEYDLIVNLDTGFMPCVLTRFLKDAGEPVQGNFTSMSLQHLLQEFQQQTLEPAYVNEPVNFMESTWFSMSRWHTQWWTSDNLPEHGYPEYYLKFCCGFNDLQMNMQIEVDTDKDYENRRQHKKVIALALAELSNNASYPFTSELQQLLEQAGYYVWISDDKRLPLKQTLSQLKSSDLLVTVPSAAQWQATSVSCPSLLICGEQEPRTLMPDYATEQSALPIPPQQLLESINSIFAEQSQ